MDDIRKKLEALLQDERIKPYVEKTARWLADPVHKEVIDKVAKDLSAAVVFTIVLNRRTRDIPKEYQFAVRQAVSLLWMINRRDAARDKKMEKDSAALDHLFQGRV